MSGCESPPAIPNGTVVTVGSNRVGDKVEYRCDQGFFLIGNKNRECLKDGSWDGREPKCSKGGMRSTVTVGIHSFGT